MYGGLSCEQFKPNRHMMIKQCKDDIIREGGWRGLHTNPEATASSASDFTAQKEKMSQPETPKDPHTVSQASAALTRPPVASFDSFFTETRINLHV